jgi:hypothetical protein
MSTLFDKRLIIWLYTISRKKGRFLIMPNSTLKVCTKKSKYTFGCSQNERAGAIAISRLKAKAGRIGRNYSAFLEDVEKYKKHFIGQHWRKEIFVPILVSQDTEYICFISETGACKTSPKEKYHGKVFRKPDGTMLPPYYSI